MNAGMTRIEVRPEGDRAQERHLVGLGPSLGGGRDQHHDDQAGDEHEGGGRWPSRIQFQSVGRIAAIIRRPA